MWLMTKSGMYSIVFKEEVYQVRSRVRKDLQNLIEGVNFTGEITETGNSDYPFRIYVDMEGLLLVLGFLATEVNYDNFKDMIAETPDQRHKLKFYEEIWSILLPLGSGYNDWFQNYMRYPVKNRKTWKIPTPKG